ncbi:MAG: transglutaminase domain-containing protein, partial [Campylobacterota bacterium]|nr:transglutaminase domain-containing protein [Campylobacterota bacterium]
MFTKTINPIEYFQSSPKALNTLNFILSAILILWVFATPTFAAGVKAVEKKNSLYIQNAPKRLSSYSEQAITIIQTLQKSENLSKTDKKALAKELKSLQKLMSDEESYIDESFKAMLDDIQSKKLPKLFKERVLKMQENYKGKKDKLYGVIDNIGSRYIDEENIAPYDTNDINLTSYKKDTHQRFDPNQLPSELEPTKKVKPKTTKDEFISMGYLNNPLPIYAALGDFKYDTLAEASNPSYLEPTDEIVITQAIADKAKELEYDPVKIYNFVRNNIEYIPTWGAVQSADLTLGAKRGNAMDISSLMIALFRASKIPARYVHGTITVDADKFKNWIGGFEDIYTAINYASKGDIPIVSFPPEGGKVTKIQMEHVWVEVATDYFPSRGAKNKVADSWVALDGSFKAYEYSKGIDVMAISGIDINSTVSSFISSGEMNASQNWATGFDNTILESALNDAQVNIKEYIDSNYDLNKTSLYDIIGGKRAIKMESNTLPNTLPFLSSMVGARYAKIPASLQQKMQFYIAGTTQEFVTDEFLNGKKTITLPMAKLNNEKVTLSFAPASSEDEAALNALLSEGNITDASQLPSSIPLYIHVKPQLKLNGEVIFEMPEDALGDKYTIKQRLYRVNQTLNFGQPRELIAGGFYSINTIVQSISISKLKALQDKIKSTHDTLLSNDINQISLLTREDIIGDMVYA